MKEPGSQARKHYAAVAQHEWVALDTFKRSPRSTPHSGSQGQHITLGHRGLRLGTTVWSCVPVSGEGVLSQSRHLDRVGGHLGP